MNKNNTDTSVLGIPIIIGAYAIGFKGLWGKDAVVYIAKVTFTIYALIVLFTLLVLAIIVIAKWRYR